MKFIKKIENNIPLIVSIARILIHILFFTVRVKIVNKEIYDKYLIKNNGKDNVVAGLWHRNAIFLLYFFRKLQNTLIMASRSKDGEIGARVAEKLGYIIARGSSSRGGKEALEEMITIMNTSGSKYLSGTPADGPIGPARKFKKGMAALAKETNAYYIPIGVSGDNVITFPNAWDKTMIPLPFSKVIIIFGEPFKIPSDTTDEEFRKICGDIEKTLNRLTDEADMLAGYNYKT